MRANFTKSRDGMIFFGENPKKIKQKNEIYMTLICFFWVFVYDLKNFLKIYKNASTNYYCWATKCRKIEPF